MYRIDRYEVNGERFGKQLVYGYFVDTDTGDEKSVEYEIPLERSENEILSIINKRMSESLETINMDHSLDELDLDAKIPENIMEIIGSLAATLPDNPEDYPTVREILTQAKVLIAKAQQNGR